MKSFIYRSIKTAQVAVLMLFFVSLAVSCGHGGKTGDLQPIELIYSYPISSYVENGQTRIYNMADTIAVFHLRGIVLYRLPPRRDFKTGKRIKDTEPYFIFRKGYENGFLYSSVRDSSKGVRSRVDSFLIKNAMGGLQFEMPAETGDSAWYLVRSDKDFERGTLFEKYARRVRGGATSPDSICYYFDKGLDAVDYTFSHKVDSLKGMKLVKISMLYAPGWMEAKKMMLPERELFFEVRKGVVSDPEEIRGMFGRFAKTGRD